MDTYEGEGLSTGGLAVCKNDGVIAVHGGTYMTSCDSIVDGFVLGACKDLVEAEILRCCAS